MTKRSLFITAGVVALVAAGGVGVTAAANAAPTDTHVPITSDAVQAADESQVATFLATHTEPSRGTGTPAELNAYWTKQAAYWNAVPWKAVAGQWGCTISAVGVTFNPVDTDGVRSAGVGSVSFCGTGASDLLSSVATQVHTRSTLISENPSLASLSARNEP